VDTKACVVHREQMVCAGQVADRDQEVLVVRVATEDVGAGLQVHAVHQALQAGLDPVVHVAPLAVS